MCKKVLATGLTGFVGKYIEKLLINNGIEYRSLVRRNINSENAIKVDFSNVSNLTSVISGFRPDVILHLAAIANPVCGNVSEIYNVNVAYTNNLLEACRNAGLNNTRILLTSTAGVYGNHDVSLLSEIIPYNPINHYSYSKMAMELLSKQYEDEFDIHIIRPFNMIGIGQKENFLIPKLIKSFVDKKEVLYVGNIQTERDYIDVEYAAKVFYKLLIADELKQKIYNICSGKSTRGIDIINYLSEFTGYIPKIEINEEFTRRNEIDRLVGDPRKINRFMGDEKNMLSTKEIISKMYRQYIEV